MAQELRVCILASGGIDSSLLIHQALQESAEVHPLYIAFDFFWEPLELESLKKLLQKMATPSLKELLVSSVSYGEFFPEHWGYHTDQVPDRHAPDTEVLIPGRNLFLFSQGALHCHSQDLSEIWIGSLKGNPYPDAEPTFFVEMEQLLSKAWGRDLKIRAPFRHLSKWELVNQFPDFPYHLTVTCLRPQGDHHCGNCNKCEERRINFQKAGLRDPTHYLFNP